MSKSIRVSTFLMDGVMKGEWDGPTALRAEKVRRAAEAHERKGHRLVLQSQQEFEAMDKARAQYDRLLAGEPEPEAVQVEAVAADQD